MILKNFRKNLKKEQIVKIKFWNNLYKWQLKRKFWFWIFVFWEVVFFRNEEEAFKQIFFIWNFLLKNIYPEEY